MMPETLAGRLAVTAGIACAFLVAVLLLAEWMKRASLFFPERYPSGQWDFSRVRVPASEHWMTTPDGIRLHGVLFGKPAPGEPLLLYVHGNGGNLTHRIAFATEFVDRGLPVFLFDYRGYGRSEGSPSEAGLAVDSVTAYDYVRSSLGMPPETVALFGESLGGAYAARIASERPVRCVVIVSSFASIERVARALFPIGPLAMIHRNSLPTARWLNRGKRPALVIHGVEDEILPYHLGVELYDSLTVPKQFIEVPGAGHNDIMEIGGAPLFDRITEFVRK